MRKLIFICCLTVSSYLTSHAQEENIRVFLDCDLCDESYQKRELHWIEFVRDPSDADIHAWVISQGNSSNGRQYTFRFIGKESLNGEKKEIRYDSENWQTDIEVQQDISTVLIGGILPLALKLEKVPDLNASTLEQEDGKIERMATDPWNFWVFELGVGVWVNLEQRRRDFEFTGDLRINRTTEESRLRIRLDYNFESNLIRNKDGDIQSRLNTISLQGSHVWSLGKNWSIGFFGEVFSNSVVNTDLGFKLNPALEFNIFPYDESHIREFTFAWYAGPFYRQYGEETLFGEISEWLIGEQLSIDYKLNRPWGRLNLELDAFHYFEDIAKNRFSFEAGLDKRMTRGLFIGLDADYSIIHDQIYLPRGDIPIEDVLLRRQTLATTYEFSLRISLSYTFGSVFNSIVNTRL